MKTMRLYSVSISWRFKGMRKRRGVFGYAIAENEREAVEKLKNIITIPSEAIEIDYFPYEEKSGVSVAVYK